MIRTAEFDDYKGVKKLIRQGEAEGALVHRRKKEIKKAIGKGRTLVAEEEGKLVGTVSVDVFSRQIAEVRSLYVDPAYRGTGTANALVEGLLEQPVKVLPSGIIFAVTTTPKVFEKSGFSSKQGERQVIMKSI